MKRPHSGLIIGAALWAGAASAPMAQDLPQFTGAQVLTNGEVLLKLTAPANQNFRIERSTDLSQWTGLTTFRSTGSNQFTDSAAAFADTRFYRAKDVAGTNVVTGDHLATSQGEATFHPIDHATFVIAWNGKTVYCDPVGGAAMFQGLPRADLILVSHNHGDHYDSAAINAVRGSNAVVLAPRVVYSAMSASLKAITTVLTNGSKTNLLDLEVEAVPAYNLTSSFHPKGTGNGYVLTLGGKRIYMSGDTEDIPEMRALADIDAAFVCMNLPFTMPVDKAADATREFRPKIIYPYHYRGSDLNRFKQLVGTDRGVEVRLRNWY